MYPGKRIIVFGLEQEDESFNGLTLEQQAAVDEAVAMGRWNSVGRSA
jgi:hypothetical protein